MPNSINSNDTNLAFAEEETLKTLPGSPIWYGLEPNSYPDFGASLALVTRTPITNTRQQAKGTTTDLDAKGGFQTDLTARNLTRLLQGFFFQDAFEHPSNKSFGGTAVPVTAVAAHAFDAASGFDSAGFKVGMLIHTKNFTKTDNNGLFALTGVAAGALTVAETLTVDAAPVAASQIDAVGYQFGSGDLALTVVGATVVLTSTAITAMSDLGLQVGEWIFVGGDAAGTFYALNTPFFARVKSIVGKTVVLDSTMIDIVSDAGAAKTIQVFFGTVLANATDAANIVRRSYTIERQLGEDAVDVQAEYLVGAIPNELTINASQASKVTADLTFVAMDVAYKTGTEGILSANIVAAPFEDPYNTSHDIVAARLAVIDPADGNPTGLFAYLTDFKLVVNNNVSPNKALAVLGAFEASVGNFDVSGTATAYFADVAAAAAIRNNSDVELTAIFAKAHSGIVIDVPLITLGNGSNKVEKDKSVMVDLTINASKNAHDYTTMWTFFEYLPTAAMPV